MKKLQRILCVMLSVLLLTGATFSVGAVEKMSEEENTTEHQTMGEIEKEVIEYLKEYHPEITFGTEEYASFLTELLMQGNEKELEKRADYKNIEIYASEYLADSQEVYVNNKLVLTLSDKQKEYTVADVKKQAAEEEKRDEAEESESLTRTTRAVSGYSPQKAAAYGIKWGKKRNPKYASHMKDCTNFVSQCLVAGGLKMERPRAMKEGVYESTDYWYSVRYEEWHTNSFVYRWNESSSFIRVKDLYKYSKSVGGTKRIICDTKKDLQENAKIGDIVQLKNEKGKWYHSIIITAGKKGNYSYAGHTNDNTKTPLKDIKQKIVQWRIIRF